MDPRIRNDVDFLVVGAGIVGLAVALELRRLYPDASISVLEKEEKVASHASTRNSGVIHSGFYYTPDSLKARLSVDGNRRLYEFCMLNDVPVLRCGKVVVAQRENQLDDLQSLLNRGIANGVDVRLITDAELRQIEPLAKTTELALWSPNTGVSDPFRFAVAIEKRVRQSGIQIKLISKVTKIRENEVHTASGEILKFKHLINSAGLYADKLAKMMGFGTRYTMIPFIGLYYFAPTLRGSLNSHIYPTPDSRNPFLGVHFTKTITNDVKVGPTAIPLLSREQYEWFSSLRLDEFAELLLTYPKLLRSKNHDTWGLIRTELPKLSRRILLGKARDLSNCIDISKFDTRGKPGIRAQLFDVPNSKLEMDFVIEGDSMSTHILNAVSPGWTTCLSFAEHLVKDMSRRLNK